MLKAASLSHGHFCGFISHSPADDFHGGNFHDSGRAVFSKCCYSISPQPSPWLSVVQSLQTLPIGVQVLFPVGSFGKDTAWLWASSLSVCTSGPRRESLPLKPFSELKGKEMGAGPLRDGAEGPPALPGSSLCSRQKQNTYFSVNYTSFSLYKLFYCLSLSLGHLCEEPESHVTDPWPPILKIRI